MNPRVQLNTLVHDLEIENVIIIDASSNGSPAAHTELFHRGFRIISANKNPLSGENFAVASQMLSSQKYGGEATVMAGQWALRFVGEERLNPQSTGPIDSIESIELIGSGTLAGIARDLERGVAFSEAVRAAMERGDTEPNPNDDLDGADLGKKLVILARKAGYNIGLSNIVYGDGLLGATFRSTFDGQDWKTDDTKNAFIKKIQDERDVEMKDLIDTRKSLVPRYGGTMRPQTDGTVKFSVGIEFVGANSELGVAQYNKLVVTVNRGNDVVDTRVLWGKGAGPIQTAQWIMQDLNRIEAHLPNRYTGL